MSGSIKIIGLIIGLANGPLKIVKGPFLFARKMLFSSVVLKVFERYLFVKNKFIKKTTSKKEKIILAFANRHVVHIILTIIALGVATSNLLAYEKKENYGQKALIYQIIGVENLDEGSDSVFTTEESKISSYTGESAQLQSELYTEAQKQEEQIYEEQFKSELALLQGGALIKPDLVSTEAAKITRTSIRDYVVAEGDSIGRIADKFNITVNTILWANNLSFTSMIKPGQKLIIPPTSGVIHNIKKGDTLAAIAKKYDASESKIREFNKIESSALLVVGETIMVPGGRIIYTQTPRAATKYAQNINYQAPATSSGGMIWPSACHRITQYYRGWIHTGTDIACAYGTAIRAAAGGTVVRVQYGRTGYGYNVIISHGGGKQTLYGHMSRIDVVAGQQVARGEVIGLEGSTGRSTGPHLHFEVILNGSKTNPLNYVR